MIRGLAARLREGQELLDHGDDLRVVRRDLERALGGGERLERLLERSHVEAREIDLTRHAAAALLEITLLLEDRGGAFGVTGGEQQAPERAEGADVARIEIEDLAIEDDRLRRRAEGLLLEERPLGEDGDARLTHGCAPRAKPEQPAEVLAAVGRGPEQPVERDDRLVVLLVGEDQLAVGVDGGVALTGVGRRDVGELEAQRTPLLVVGRRRARTRLERLHERGPFAGRARPLLELADRARLARRELERLRRVTERRGLVGELVARDDRELLVECTLFAVGLGVREQRLVERRQGGPTSPRPRRGARAPVAARRVGGGGRRARARRRGTRDSGAFSWPSKMGGGAEREVDLERDVGGAVCGGRQDLDEPPPSRSTARRARRARRSR